MGTERAKEVPTGKISTEAVGPKDFNILSRAERLLYGGDSVDLASTFVDQVFSDSPQDLVQRIRHIFLSPIHLVAPPNELGGSVVSSLESMGSYAWDGESILNKANIDGVNGGRGKNNKYIFIQYPTILGIPLRKLRADKISVRLYLSQLNENGETDSWELEICKSDENGNVQPLTQTEVSGLPVEKPLENGVWRFMRMEDIPDSPRKRLRFMTTDEIMEKRAQLK